ncbi:hypothetical protein C8R43DRAFT_94524 [Mycena crocata]|nr:hypothetical protein C8R43DRAFT_94524 [Mycena crocata]
MDIMAPTLYSSEWREWINENQRTTHALLKCIENANCGQNQRKVVIIESHHFLTVMNSEWAGGEGIWATSTLRALENLGFSVLFSSHPERTIQLYHIFEVLVKMVLCDPATTLVHWNNETVRTPDNPTGIPVWKIFSYEFFWHNSNPLGPQWTLSAEDYRALGSKFMQNTYLGYSIEEECATYPFIPHAERNREAWIIAKALSYFHPLNRAWTPDFFDLAANSTGASFATGAGPPIPQHAHLNMSEVDLSQSVENLGVLIQDDFNYVLSRSMAVVGMGDPILSPTPYNSLCFGVPFVNPICSWNRRRPSDRSAWNTQHDMLKDLSPPYVYHVFKGDRDGFVNAIRDALANPIERYVPERMKMTSVEERLWNILEHDWRGEAEKILKKREKSGKGRMFIL